MTSAMPFGELTIRPTNDAGVTVIDGPPSGITIYFSDTDPDQARKWTRTTRLDGTGQYRPLPSARTMPAGWQVYCPKPERVAPVLDAIYPLARRHQAQFAAGTLRIVPLQEVFERQSGRYRDALQLSEEGRTRARARLCTRCVKTPVWASEEMPAGGIPCPEACSIMLSLCREAAHWEQMPPAPAPPDTGVAWAAFETPGNEIREEYLRRALVDEAPAE